jgi:hypothetical protein
VAVTGSRCDSQVIGFRTEPVEIPVLSLSIIFPDQAPHHFFDRKLSSLEKRKKIKKNNGNSDYLRMTRYTAALCGGTGIADMVVYAIMK